MIRDNDLIDIADNNSTCECEYDIVYTSLFTDLLLSIIIIVSLIYAFN